MPLSLPPLHHVGIVVADFDAAARDFEHLWGVPTEGLMEPSFDEVIYRGSPIEMTARYGFIRTGASELELIQPLAGPSPYADFLTENGGEGIHHLAYIVESIDAYLDQLRDAQPETIASIRDHGVRIVYISGVGHGPVIELIEMPKQPSDG